MVLARQLLQHFGSVRRIANATEDELCGLRGIGARKAKQIVKVLTAEYEAVDAERDLEDAVEAEPALLFRRGVELLARQHVIFSEGPHRHVVDMVFRDAAAGEVILVELKRGKLAAEHAAQLRRYLDRAGQSRLLREHVASGAGVRGVLATVEPGGYEPGGDKPGQADITARVVDRGRVIRVLKRLRARRLARP
jgi:hypothetical protein